MTVIWGFNLSETHWRAFRNENMFDKRWHLRRERLGEPTIYVLYRSVSLVNRIPRSERLCYKVVYQVIIVHLFGLSYICEVDAPSWQC